MIKHLWESVTLNTFVSKDVIRIYRTALEQNPGIVTLGGDIKESSLKRLEIMDIPIVLSYDNHLNQLNLTSLDTEKPLYPNPQAVTYLAPEESFLRIISTHFNDNTAETFRS